MRPITVTIVVDECGQEIRFRPGLYSGPEGKKTSADQRAVDRVMQQVFALATAVRSCQRRDV